MDLLVSASMISAFIAGVAALFAPCCITVLLPSYLGSIFHERRKVFLMTFVFFLGILLVFLPLGMGSAAFGQLLSRYHNTVFILMSAMLLALGITLLLGKNFSLPFHVNPTLKDKNYISVFILGIFSGIATTCCAPVLAGVLALAALPGSIYWGIIYTLSYVLGMVAPLFFIASFLDKTQINKKMMAIRKPITYSLFGKQFSITIAQAVSGVVFVVMGGITLFLASTNRLNLHAGYQIDINIFLTKLMIGIKGFTSLFPEYVWAIFFVLIFAGIIYKAIKLFKKESYENRE